MQSSTSTAAENFFILWLLDQLGWKGPELAGVEPSSYGERVALGGK